MAFNNCYEDAIRADAYAQLEFANTYHLAFRDLPQIVREHTVQVGPVLAARLNSMSCSY